MEYSQSDSEEEEDDDEGPRNTQGGGNRLGRPIDYDNFVSNFLSRHMFLLQVYLIAFQT